MGQDGFYGYQEPKPVNPDGPGRARVWLFDCDLTKSPSDDVGIALDELPDHLVNGSRIRTTDKAGPGTKGTRAVEGIGPCAIALR